MRALLALVPVTLFALASCGSSGSSPSSGGGDSTLSAGGGSLRSCVMTCAEAADCAIPGQPLQDAAHYACTAGRCKWRGCASTSDCSAALGTTKVACATAPGAPVASCVPACQTAADCAVPGSALSDANHFACTAGICEWQGCKSTSECTTALSSSHYACDKPGAAPVKTCVPTCQTAADCAIPGSPMDDASHFACTAGRCMWQGCKSTGECTAALNTARTVCE